MSVVLVLVGVLIVLLVFAEAFEALVLPRRVVRPFRLTRIYYRTVWRAWTYLADRFPPSRTRETLLAIFGPLSLVTLFALWATMLMFGFGLLHFALDRGPLSFEDALYFSGTTFTTIGYGDVNPGGTMSRVLAVAEGATGFGFFAVVVAYLPVLYQSFSGRERFIALLDARAGSHPAAARLLLRFPPGKGDGAVLNAFLNEAERWAADVLESHLSYPVLGYYRSQHDNQSWLAALTCTLDASALLLTVVDGADRNQARLTFAMARHTLVDLGLVLGRQPVKLAADRLPDGRLRELLAALREAGVAVRDDDAAVARLAELRGLYEPFAAGAAAYFRLFLPHVWPQDERPDNWQTSAWMRRADPITALGADPRDEHFG